MSVKTIEQQFAGVSDSGGQGVQSPDRMYWHSNMVLSNSSVSSDGYRKTSVPAVAGSYGELLLYLLMRDYEERASGI